MAATFKTIYNLLLTFYIVNFLYYGDCSGLGKCPRVDYMSDFNLTQFAGHWYEIERSFYLMEIVSNCVNIDIIHTDSKRLYVSVTSKSSWAEGITVSEGVAIEARRNPSVFSYRVSSDLPKILSKHLPGSGVYQIVDTDYNTYAILYSCSNYDFAHSDLLWIWARQKDINATLRANLYDKLETQNLDSERLILPDNRNCTN